VPRHDESTRTLIDTSVGLALLWLVPLAATVVAFLLGT